MWKFSLAWRTEAFDLDYLFYCDFTNFIVWRQSYIVLNERGSLSAYLYYYCYFKLDFIVASIYFIILLKKMNYLRAKFLRSYVCRTTFFLRSMENFSLTELIFVHSARSGAFFCAYFYLFHFCLIIHTFLNDWNISLEIIKNPFWEFFIYNQWLV